VFANFSPGLSFGNPEITNFILLETRNPERVAPGARNLSQSLQDCEKQSPVIIPRVAKAPPLG
jgi:hypothetical protein